MILIAKMFNSFFLAPDIFRNLFVAMVCSQVSQGAGSRADFRTTFLSERVWFHKELGLDFYNISRHIVQIVEAGGGFLYTYLIFH